MIPIFIHESYSTSIPTPRNLATSSHTPHLQIPTHLHPCPPPSAPWHTAAHAHLRTYGLHALAIQTSMYHVLSLNPTRSPLRAACPIAGRIASRLVNCSQQNSHALRLGGQVILNIQMVKLPSLQPCDICWVPTEACRVDRHRTSYLTIRRILLSPLAQMPSQSSR